MQIIGFFHVLFDVLAFRSDIGFWKGRETMTGLSSRAVISSAAQTIIVYLYLLDAEGVNQIVLGTYTVSTLIELWKVVKVLRIMRVVKAREAQRREEQAQRERQREGGEEKPCVGLLSSATPNPPASPSVDAATERFDALATRTLGIGLAPLVAGWALYALVHYPHVSWYSWLISSLADAVYFCGFIGMTPQLFINYKLKSVAHMPWRVMAYKAFNTFIDDVFAVMVAMPMHHRVACLRDDAVFFVFLYQRWLYPVDKKRANEYGIAYEREDVEGHDGEEAHDGPDAPSDGLDRRAITDGGSAISTRSARRVPPTASMTDDEVADRAQHLHQKCD
jgi:hypothetical protein